MIFIIAVIETQVNKS